ncbi:MAG TPA: hypothetical protein VLM91_08765 [Candidatus Methylomirabilis sp.]|nr:hypothetical protein [Candidatus Methylomirabilis sp.]
MLARLLVWPTLLVGVARGASALDFSIRIRAGLPGMTPSLPGK